MVDSYVVGIEHTMADSSTIWSDVRTAMGAVESLYEVKGTGFRAYKWSLTSNSRTWQRATLDELHKIALDNGLTNFYITWIRGSHKGDDWMVMARIPSRGPSTVRAKVFGRDRMEVEGFARAFHAGARGLGLEFEMGETEISSTDVGPEVVREPKPEPVKPDGQLMKVWTSVRPHLAVTFVSVASTVVAAVLVVWLT